MSNDNDDQVRAGVSASVAEARLRVISAASDLCGDSAKALNWYRTEALAAFDFKTAELLVSEGRAGDVLRYLTSVSVGAAG